MATHSSILAWRIPGTEEPGGLPAVGSHRVGHNWNDLAAAAANLYLSRIYRYEKMMCAYGKILGKKLISYDEEYVNFFSSLFYFYAYFDISEIFFQKAEKDNKR